MIKIGGLNKKNQNQTVGCFFFEISLKVYLLKINTKDFPVKWYFYGRLIFWFSNGIGRTVHKKSLYFFSFQDILDTRVILTYKCIEKMFWQITCGFKDSDKLCVRKKAKTTSRVKMNPDWISREFLYNFCRRSEQFKKQKN